MKKLLIIFGAALSAFTLGGCANTTKILETTYAEDGKTVAKTIETETDESIGSILAKAYVDDSKNKFRVVWMDANKFDLGITYTSGVPTLGVGYLSMNGGFIDVPFKVDGTPLITLDKDAVGYLANIVKATKLDMGVSYDNSGDFSFGTGSSASATSANAAVQTDNTSAVSTTATENK